MEEKIKKENRKVKTILALDLGTTTGWAIKNQFGVTSGNIDLRPGRFAGGGMRFLNFQKWLGEIPKVDIVFFEEVRKHLGVDAAHTYGGYLAVLTSWCEHGQIPYQSIPVGTIKRFITGKGNASKSEVIEGVKTLGYEPKCDNEADALALLHLAVEYLSPTKNILQEEKHEH